VNSIDGGSTGDLVADFGAFSTFMSHTLSQVAAILLSVIMGA